MQATRENALKAMQIVNTLIAGFVPHKEDARFVFEVLLAAAAKLPREKKAKVKTNQPTINR